MKAKTRPDKFSMSRDRFLVIGGIDPFRVSEYETSRMVEEFVPYKSEWNKKNTLPDSRHHACACLLDGFIYLVGEYTTAQFEPLMKTTRYIGRSFLYLYDKIMFLVMLYLEFAWFLP